MLKRITQFLRNQINQMIMNMQMIYFDNNDPANHFQITFFQIMIVILTIQEIQLLQNDQRYQHIMLKYNINLLLYSKNSDSNTNSIFIATMNIILIAVLCIITQLRLKSTMLLYYLIHIYILILSTPIIMNSIQLIYSENFIVLGSISLLFQILFKIMQTRQVRQFKIIDIELSFQDPFNSFLQYILQVIVIFLKMQEIHLGDVILLIKTILTILLIMNRYNINKFINLFCLSLELTLCICSIFNLEWFDSFIIMSGITYLIQQISEYIKYIVIFQKKFNFQKFQLFLRFQIEQIKTSNKQNQQNDIIILYFRQQNLNYNQIPQLYEKLYKQNKCDYFFTYCYYLYITNFILCSIFIIQHFNEFHQSSPLIQIIKSKLKNEFHKTSMQIEDLHMIIMQLYQEEDLKQYIDELIQSILLILQKLQKKTHENAYQKQILDTIRTESKTLQKLQKFVNKNIDLHRYTLKPFKHSNIILLNFLKQYYIVLYSDYQKANQINDMQLDLCGWNKQLNLDLTNNTALITMNLSDNDGYFYKLNQNRLKSLMNTQLCPIQIDQILPPYLRKIHQIKIQQFKNDGQLRNGELLSYYYNQGFIYPGKLQLQYRIQDNQFLADLLLTKVKNTKDVIMFDSTGKILGISKQLYKYLLTKNDSVMNEIDIYKFIELAYIQFYIPSILESIQQLLLNLQQDKQTYPFQDKWSFPVNHGQCLQMTQRASQLSKSNIQFSESSIRDFHKTKQLIKSSSKIKTFILNPEFENIYKIEMLEQEYFLKFNQLIIPGAIVKSLQLEYQLKFHQLKYQNETLNYFYLYVNKLEDFQQQIDGLNIIVQSDEQKYLMPEEDQSSKFSMEELINTNAIIKPIKKLIIAELIFIIFLITCVMINVQVNSNLILNQENSINFLIFPQALTFAYCATYLLQWNRYSTINQLYNLTPYVESQRQAKLAYTYNLWKGIDLRYTIGLDEYGIQNNKENLLMKRIQNGTLIYDEIRIFEFYQIYREQMHQMYKENNLSNVNQQNYNILKADGFIRQNLFEILRYHDFVMNGIIDRQSEQIFLAVSYIKVFLFTELLIVCLSIVLQGYLIFLINNLMSVPIQFLSYMDNNYILERELPLKTFKINQTFFESNLLPSVENRDDQQMDSKYLLINEARNKAIKLINFKISQFFDTLIPILKIIILIIIFLVVYYVSLNYFQQYKQSLLLTLQYIRFKKLFDSSLIVGELIKTEHLIQDNPIQYINQTESIELFFHYTDQIQPEFNKIIDQLISADFFNATMKDKVLKIFSQNLCNYFAYLLVFCNTSKIKLSFNESDSYIGLIEQGISGIIQTYIKLVQSEFTYEKSNLQYDFNKTKQSIYLQTQIHQNIFVQYFQDIQSCFFMCFSYFITETQKYGGIVIYNIELLYMLLGIVLLLIIFIASMIWIYFKQKQFEILKYALVILPSSVIQKESLKKQLINYKNKLY